MLNHCSLNVVVIVPSQMAPGKRIEVSTEGMANKIHDIGNMHSLVKIREIAYAVLISTEQVLHIFCTNFWA